MVFANFMAGNRGLVRDQDISFVNDQILIPNVPLKLRERDFDEVALLKSMKNDKKRVGEFLSVVIPEKRFEMSKVDDVTDAEFHVAFRQTKKAFIG